MRRAAPRHLRRLWPQERLDRVRRRPRARPAEPADAWQRPTGEVVSAAEILASELAAPPAPPGRIGRIRARIPPLRQVTELPPEPDGTVVVERRTVVRRVPGLWPLPALSRGLVGLSLLVGAALALAMVGLFVLVFVTMGTT
jgi:hypothetical protein